MSSQFLEPCAANRASRSGSEAETRRPASSRYPGGGREARTLLRLRPRSSSRIPVAGYGLDSWHRKVTPRALLSGPSDPRTHEACKEPNPLGTAFSSDSGPCAGFRSVGGEESKPSLLNLSFRDCRTRGPDSHRIPHTIEGYRSSASCLASGPFLRSRSSSGSEPGLPPSRSPRVGRPEDTWTHTTCLQVRLVSPPFAAGKPARR